MKNEEPQSVNILAPTAISFGIPPQDDSFVATENNNSEEEEK